MLLLFTREEEEEEDKKAQQGEKHFIFLCLFLCGMNLIRAETPFFFLFLSLKIDRDEEMQKKVVLKYD